MATFYATFGRHGPLANCYCKVPADTEDSATELMRHMYTSNWEDLVSESEKARLIDKLKMREIKFGELAIEQS